MMSASVGEPALQPVVKRMIDDVRIVNFRSFREMRLENCRLVNIVVGENGSGKTTLLEAIFLAAGVSPEIAMRTKSWRGYDSGRIWGSREDIHEALWADMFHRLETNKAAVVTLRGSGDENRSVTVNLNKVGKVNVVPRPRDKPYLNVRVEPERSPIEFKWKIQGRPDVVVRPQIVDDKLVFNSAPARNVRASFFAANRTSANIEVVSRFSSLTRTFQEAPLFDLVRSLYPQVRGLSIEMSAGSPMVYADVGLPEKIPLSLASGGLNKLVAMLVAMDEQAGGLILVDEIENGFYHRRLPELWRGLVQYARRNQCQMFVSTHSNECLKAAAEIAKEASDDFCILQTALSKNFETEVSKIEGEVFTTAIADNIEIR